MQRVLKKFEEESLGFGLEWKEEEEEKNSQESLEKMKLKCVKWVSILVP